jgi:hypothetical protein
MRYGLVVGSLLLLPLLAGNLEAQSPLVPETVLAETCDSIADFRVHGLTTSSADYGRLLQVAGTAPPSARLIRRHSAERAVPVCAGRPPSLWPTQGPVRESGRFLL